MQHAGTKRAIAETSTLNCRLVFSCGSAAVSGRHVGPLHLLLLDAPRALKGGKRFPCLITLNLLLRSAVK